MNIDDNLVSQLARLAQLEFSGEEKEEMIADMQKIIGFVQKLESLDVSGVAPARWATPNMDFYRKDQPGETMDAHDALTNAARHDDQFLEVPKFINK